MSSSAIAFQRGATPVVNDPATQAAADAADAAAAMVKKDEKDEAVKKLYCY